MRIERLIPCSPKDLWKALIRHTELTERGALLRLPLGPGVSHAPGTITAYESERLLECAWGSDVLRWELQARAGGTLLVFTHAECAAQWLACLDHLAARATGAAELEATP